MDARFRPGANQQTGLMCLDCHRLIIGKDFPPRSTLFREKELYSLKNTALITLPQRERQVCNIKDVVPRKYNWKVLIQVLERKKSGISKSTTNPTEYRGYLFIDTMGTMVSAVCYGGDVAFFETSLMPYKRYYISNAYVKPAKQGYEVGDYAFSWTLYSTATVEPLDEIVPPPIPYDFQFKQFSEMFRYADRESPINIKGLIVEAFAEKKVGQDLIAQDFIIVDTEKTPMIMRLLKEKIKMYGDILSEDLPNPVMFVGMNMKVTTFNGLSVSSRFNTVFLKEPVIAEGPALKEWYALNKKDVDALLSKLAYKDTDMLFKKPIAADIIPVADAMATLDTIKTAWIAGKIKLIPGQDRYWYMACKNCHKSLASGHQKDMPCASCDQPDPINLKCHIGVLITDASATAYAEMYSPDAELLVPFTASQLKEAEEEGRCLRSELEAALENKHVVCYIKYFDKLIRGAVTRKYPLVKIYHYKDVFPGAALLINAPETMSVVGDKLAIDLTKDNEDDVQFFTPSTKVLIEEISASSQINDVDDAAQSGCKRVLSFNDVQKSTVNIKVEPIDDDIPPQSMVDTSASIESPARE